VKSDTNLMRNKPKPVGATVGSLCRCIASSTLCPHWSSTYRAYNMQRIN